MLSGQRNSSASSNPKATFKFPNYDLDRTHEHAIDDSERTYSPARGVNGHPREVSWQSRKTGSSAQTSSSPFRGFKRGRQKSLSEALKNIHNRRGSVTENAREIGEALKAPVSPTLVFLCGVWYMTSIFSNASSKAILVAFRQPVTLTLIQFAFVSSWCVFSAALARRYPKLRTWIPALKHEIQKPSRELIITTLPLTAFQIGGHILNSDAMSRIPVSLVHTIKGLSPLFTVLAYRIIFRVHYTIPTYLSLIPLTLGVIMACSANFSASFIGLACAFGSAILFVTQNIVSKKLFNEAARAESEGVQQLFAAKKPDKLNLLCYSSALAFAFTVPIWLWSEAPGLARDFMHDGSLDLIKRPDALQPGRLALEFIFNGSFHFAQSLVAFVLLSMVSPVTYSVASLIKRVFVIVFAVVWFGNPLTRVQASGIGLTFVGLYLYDRTNDAARADRRARLQQGRDTPLLPLIQEDKKIDLPARIPTPLDLGHAERRPSPAPPMAAQMMLNPEDRKTAHTGGRSSPLVRANSNDSATWMRPGTKQEDTWKAQEVPPHTNGVAV